MGQASRLPIPLEITVSLTGSGDEADAIAALVSSLRNGYSHTADGTFLPAPLSFRSKIFDYMDRYGTGSDPDPTEPPSDEEFAEAPEDAESDTASEDASVGFADVKRWFEGTSEFANSDIPDFDGDGEGDTVDIKPPTAQPPPDDRITAGEGPPTIPSAPASAADSPAE